MIKDFPQKYTQLLDSQYLQQHFDELSIAQAHTLCMSPNINTDCRLLLQYFFFVKNSEDIFDMTYNFLTVEQQKVFIDVYGQKCLTDVKKFYKSDALKQYRETLFIDTSSAGDLCQLIDQTLVLMQLTKLTDDEYQNFMALHDHQAIRTFIENLYLQFFQTEWDARVSDGYNLYLDLLHTIIDRTTLSYWALSHDFFFQNTDVDDFMEKMKKRQMYLFDYLHDDLFVIHTAKDNFKFLNALYIRQRQEKNKALTAEYFACELIMSLEKHTDTDTLLANNTTLSDFLFMYMKDSEYWGEFTEKSWKILAYFVRNNIFNDEMVVQYIRNNAHNIPVKKLGKLNKIASFLVNVYDIHDISACSTTLSLLHGVDFARICGEDLVPSMLNIFRHSESSVIPEISLM